MYLDWAVPDVSLKKRSLLYYESISLSPILEAGSSQLRPKYGDQRPRESTKSKLLEKYIHYHFLLSG
jgi:hypothetical protein